MKHKEMLFEYEDTSDPYRMICAVTYDGWYKNSFCNVSHPIILYVTDGLAVIKTKNSEYACEKGSMIFIPEKNSCEFIIITSCNLLEMIPNINLSSRFINSLKTNIQTITVLDRMDLFVNMDEAAHFDRNDDFELLKLFNKIDTAIISSIDLYLGKKDEFKAFLLAVLKKSIGQQITLKDIAQEMSLSITHLERLCNSQFNCSVMQLYQKIKIEQAIAELIFTNKSICKISQELGYFDQAHFSRTFKRAIGLSPSSYKDKHEIARIL